MATYDYRAGRNPARDAATAPAPQGVGVGHATAPVRLVPKTSFAGNAKTTTKVDGGQNANRDLTQTDQLPVFERIFGTGSKEPNFNNATRSGVVGLVHADNTCTVLVAKNHDHLYQSFCVQLDRHGIKPVGSALPSTSDFVMSLYQRSDASAARRNLHDKATNPDEVNKVLLTILHDAMQQGASDVDIHVLDKASPPFTNVAFRIHGVFIKQAGVLTDTSVAGAVLRAAYTGEFADSNSRSHSSYNTIEGMYATLQIPALKNLRLRLQTNPHALGHGVNLRTLSYDGLQSRYTNLQDMGFSEGHEREIIDSFSGERGGLNLFIAGTGEGKTTTLMTAIPLDRKFDQRKWVSIEDPVEILNPRIFQIPIRRNTSNDADNSGYVAAMTNTLRFDPDGINAGEIRDEISAKLAERAAMTGHITAATLHGTEIFTAFHRLIDLGARKVNLLDGVARMFCHQKLVQTICPHCSTQATQAKGSAHRTFIRELEANYGVDAGMVKIQGTGCEHCYPKNNPLAGISGRTVVAEVVRFNRDIITALRRSDDTEPARQAWRSQRVAGYDEEGTLGKTIGEHALYKLLQGQISPETFLGIAGSFDTHAPMAISGRERVRP